MLYCHNKCALSIALQISINLFYCTVYFLQLLISQIVQETTFGLEFKSANLYFSLIRLQFHFHYLSALNFIVFIIWENNETIEWSSCSQDPTTNAEFRFLEFSRIFTHCIRLIKKKALKSSNWLRKSKNKFGICCWMIQWTDFKYYIYSILLKNTAD